MPDESTTKKTKKKKKLRKLKALAHPKSQLLEGLDKVKLTERMTYGQYSGIDDKALRKAMGKKRKSKKTVKIEESAANILRDRRQQRTRKTLEKSQQRVEREKIKAEAIAVVEVPKPDQEAFLTTLDNTTQGLRNFMLMELASTQFGVQAALDKVLQELNIIVDGGVTVRAIAPFLRLNDEIALVSITRRMCELYGLDRRTTRKIIDAKIEFMRPIEIKPTPKLPGPSSNGVRSVGAHKGRSPPET